MNLEKYIENLNKKFIKEAIDSPSLISDMAMMEKYMSESYNDRILVELLQNADDASSKNVKLCFSENYMYFANDGRNFSERDIESISRSGNSSKKRGDSIGYRGVGFKSSTAISNEIYIYSSNVLFSFSKKLCSKTLNMNEENVPTVRIPFLIDKNNIDKEIINNIEMLNMEEYSTIFIFKTKEYNRIYSELQEINGSFLMFLKNLLSFNIDTPKDKRKINLIRENNIITLSDNGLKTRWLIEDCDKVQFAFKLDGSNIVPCSKEESVFHCFLPTYDSTPYPFKINSDFSTDPSRKHLNLDDDTKELIELSAKKFFDYFQSIINNDSNIFEIVDSVISFSKAASLFQSVFVENMINSLVLILNNGEYKKISEICIFDDIFENSEAADIRKNNNFINLISPKNNLIFDRNLKNYTNHKFALDDYIKILKDEEFLYKSDIILVAKLYSIIINNCNLNKNEFEDIYIPYENGVGLLENNGDFQLNKEFVNLLKSLTITDKLNEFFSLFNLKFDETDKKLNTNNVTKSINNVNNTTISKWKTAEEQCAIFEEFLGNKAKTVGNQNLGYDVLSIMPDGTKRYIEVKSISRAGSFVLTNNEYSSAHFNKENYYLCLIYQNESEVQFTYIKNPIDNLVLDKRVKAWEWYCEKYSGESYNVDLTD